MAGLVKKEIALSIQVAQFIANYEGYTVASTHGEFINEFFECSGFGVLWNNPSELPKKYFFGLFEELKKKKFVGVLWFNNQARGVSENKWFFEAYGKNEFIEIEPMINELAINFNVEITLFLVQEECCFEVLDCYAGY